MASSRHRRLMERAPVHRTGIVERSEHEILTPSIRSFEPGTSEPMHVHDDEGQLKWPRGHAMVSTPGGIFVLPRHWAVWIPAGQRHCGIYTEALKEHNVHVQAMHCDGLPRHCCAVRVTPKLARAVIRAIEERRLALPERGARYRALLACLREELAELGVAPVAVELPTRPRIRTIAELLLAHPSSDRSLAAWAKFVGSSSSTISRDFLEDTGLTFGDWRQRARLLSALGQLARGCDVASVAQELGYRPSSFIAMFRRALGVTPGRYFR
jgi:AraC-like DNA-binding protein